MEADKTVEVFLDGESRFVPNFVGDEDSFRACLRLPPGMGIAYAEHRDEHLEFYGSHVFVEGDQYVTIAASAPKAPETTAEDSAEPWQLPSSFEGEDPDAWKSG